MNNVGIIDTFLNTFTTYIDSGFGLLKGEVAYLSSTLIVIDITLAGLFWAWGADEDILQRLIKKTLSIGFFAFLIGNFNSLAAIVFNSFSGLGLKAGGSTLSANDFLHPGKIAEVGLDAGQPLLNAANQLMGFTSFFANFVQIAILLISWLIILIAFFILAVQLFVTLIEFKLTTLAGFVLIPFALFGRTAFLAEKVLGNIVASGIKVMVLAVIVGIGTGLFSQFTTTYASGQPTVEQALSVVLAALSLLGLGVFGPGIATGLVSGAALATAGTGTMTVLSGTAAAARGGALLAGGASSSYTLASAGRSGAPGIVSGLAGVGRAAVGGASSSVRRAAARTGETLSERFTAGSRAGFAATGGASTSGTIGEVANDASFSSAASALNASASSPPAWARKLKRGQAMSHGASTAAHAVRAGDSAGGGHSVDLSLGE